MTLPEVHITPTTVTIDGEPVPGFIDRQGITVTPGGHGGINEMTIRFIVGNVSVEDPT